MIRKTPGLIALLALAGTVSAYAQSGGADWRMYGEVDLASTGGVDKTDRDNVLFFDAAGIVRRSDGHIEVWTKALPVKELRVQPANDEGTKRFIEFSKHKLENGYVPPYSAATELDAKALTLVMLFEAAANLVDVNPTMQVLYELDCANRVLRALSIHAIVHGKLQTVDTASEWMHEPPGTPGAALIKILCTKS